MLASVSAGFWEVGDTNCRFQYAIHGGGVPIFVKGCDTMVAVAVVSGLKQWDDHQVIIEELEGLCKSLEKGKN